MKWNAFYHIRILSSHLSKSPLNVKTKVLTISLLEMTVFFLHIFPLYQIWQNHKYSGRMREARSWQPMESRVCNIIAFTNCEGSRDWLVSKVKTSSFFGPYSIFFIFFFFYWKRYFNLWMLTKLLLSNYLTRKMQLLVSFGLTISGSSEF